MSRKRILFIQSNICPNDKLLGEIMRLEDKDVLNER